MIGPYATPQAFRDALEARLRNVAQNQGTDLQRLQRRVAFERLLARLFAADDPPWLFNKDLSETGPLLLSPSEKRPTMLRTQSAQTR